MPRADGPFRSGNIYNHTLLIDRNGVLVTTSNHRAAPEPPNNKNASRGEKRNFSKSEGVTIENAHQAAESKAAERERCYTVERPTYPTLTASRYKIIDANQPCESKDLDGNGKNWRATYTAEDQNAKATLVQACKKRDKPQWRRSGGKRARRRTDSLTHLVNRKNWLLDTIGRDTWTTSIYISFCCIGHRSESVSWSLKFLRRLVERCGGNL